ncbi:MAG: murein hydrolase activator EnvC family protein [Eubacteriales bacterium]
MKRKFYKVFAAAVCALLLGRPILAGDGTTDATVQSYEDQLQSIVNKQQQALSELAEIQSSQTEAQIEIGKYDELLKYNNEMKNLASGQLDSLTEQIEDKKQIIADTTASIERQEQAFLDRMVAVYMEEDIDWMELVFEAEDLTDFLVKMERINAIMDYDSRVITELSANRQTLETEMEALEHAEETQKQRVADYETAIAQNQQIYDAKLDYMESLKSDEAKLVNNYSYYKSLENELNAELEEYLAELAREQERIRQEEERKRQEEEERKRQEELAAQQAAQQESSGWDTWDSWEDSSSGSSGSDWNSIHSQDTSTQTYTYTGGVLSWPLEAGVSYYVSSEYGWRSIEGISDFHLGIDLACDNGTPIYAAAGGTVLRSESHPSYGNYVLIDHGGGISTLYAHMSSYAVTAGETVAAGQTIGWVGLTGNTYGYHLHFEVRENGSTVEPRNYIALP